MSDGGGGSPRDVHEPPGYRSVRRVEVLTDEEVRRLAERRARHAAEDRAAMLIAADPPRRRISPLAVSAIVTAFVVPFVGLLLGIIGAVKLDRAASRSGRWLCVTAIVVSILALWFFALLL